MTATATWDLPLLTPPIPRVIAWSPHGPGELHYRMHDLWQVHLYPYACTAELGGVACTIRPGCATLTPPGAAMRYLLPARRSHLYSHFSVTGGATIAAPVLVDLGRRYDALEAGLQAAIPWTQADDPPQRQRAAARLWEVLWEIVGHAPRTTAVDPVASARDLIESRLDRRIPIPWLAREVGLSQSQLQRRFKVDLGSTVIAWIRHRRIQRAAHLLRSGDMPVGAIARAVGIADPHAFNKAVRRHLGCSPLAFRGGTAGGSD